MKQKIKLQYNIWFYLVIFCLLILLLLWSFQVLFFNKYYEYQKTKELNETVSLIKENYNNKTELDSISHDSGVCIEIYNSQDIAYTSSGFNRGCLVEGSNVLNYKLDFIYSGLESATYTLVNPRFDNKTLIKAININGYYLFISASLEPLDSAVVILKSQLVYITIIVLILSFIVAYFISKKISKPIIKINDQTNKLAKGNFDVVFYEKTDIKEISELENTLDYMKEELSKTEELRMELLSNVSHDLKTPLTMIKAYAEMVRDLTYKNKDKRNQNLNTIIEEVDRLNLLVNDILDLSVAESKLNKLNIEEFDINKMIQTIIKRYDILKGDGYSFELNNTNECLVSADKKQIEQVIYNLINNAINYTGDDKKVIISIIDNGFVRIEITDTGKGISKKDINVIWDRYYHTTKTYKRNVVGTGLGLSIVKRILINHGFKYGVLSAKGKGTTFYFEILKEK
ncbi:MAG: HAMP domain-containing sensor histidine kinase [Bacilli bacterium]|nr:HAMP domain-containing sensor histidine kinase [Bacilli bacterium]